MVVDDNNINGGRINANDITTGDTSDTGGTTTSSTNTSSEANRNNNRHRNHGIAESL